MTFPKVTIYPPARPAPEGWTTLPILETAAQWDAHMARQEAMDRADRAKDVTPEG